MPKRRAFLYQNCNVRGLDVAYDLVVRRRTRWLNSIVDLHGLCYFVCGVYRAELSKGGEIFEPAKVDPFSETLDYLSILHTITMDGDDWQIDEDYVLEVGLLDYEDAPTLFDLISLAGEYWSKIGSRPMIEILEKDPFCPCTEFVESSLRRMGPSYPGYAELYTIDQEKDLRFFQRILRFEIFEGFFGEVVKLRSGQ